MSDLGRRRTLTDNGWRSGQPWLVQRRMGTGAHCSKRRYAGICRRSASGSPKGDIVKSTAHAPLAGALLLVATLAGCSRTGTDMSAVDTAAGPAYSADAPGDNDADAAARAAAEAAAAAADAAAASADTAAGAVAASSEYGVDAGYGSPTFGSFADSGDDEEPNYAVQSARQEALDAQDRLRRSMRDLQYGDWQSTIPEVQDRIRRMDRAAADLESLDPGNSAASDLAWEARRLKREADRLGSENWRDVVPDLEHRERRLSWEADDLEAESQ